MRKLIIAIGFLSSLWGHADTTFVNLSGQSVRVARYWYTDGNSGPYNEQGWVFKGWSVIDPGDYHVSSSDHFYLEFRNNDRPVVWNGLNKSMGFVKDGGPFEGFWPKGSNASRMTNRGYRQVDFMTFRDEIFTIGNDTYRLSVKDIPFNYESRSIKFLNETIEVPGRVVSADIDGTELGGRDLKWTQNARSLRLTGSIEGRQTSPFAAREKGYYRGTIHVKYIARK